MTTPAHELGLYFTSRDLTEHGQPLPDRTVVSASPLLMTTNSSEQSTGYWDGATGFFTEDAPDVLKGFFFHVRSWTAGTDDEPGTLQLYGALPVSPPTGTVFRLCKGGKYASSQEIPGLTVSGKQPEFNPVTHSSLPGITVTKASSGLGEGTLTINTNNRNISARITTETGYGTPVTLTESVDGLVLYTGGGEGWVRMNVDFPNTTTANATGTFTLQIPKGVLVPDVEADDAADADGRLRYFCVAAKNHSSSDSVSALGVWTAPLAPETAAIQSFANATITLQAEPMSWPLKGFWVRNLADNTFRYVLNRSGNQLYLKTLSRTVHNFSSGTTHLVLGDVMRDRRTTGTILGKLLDLRITSGNLSDGNAAGTMLLSATYAGGSSNAYNERTGEIACYRSNPSSCDRNYATPGNWPANSLLEPVSDLDLIAVESGGDWHDPVSVTDKPKIDMPFRPCHSIDERALVGYLAPGDYAAFWLQQHILANVPAHAAVTGSLGFSWY